MYPSIVVKALVGCVLLIGLCVPLLSLAQPPSSPRGHRPPPERFIEKHVQQLGLDAEALAAVRKIVDEARARGEEHHLELHTAHEKMRTLLTQETPDESAVMQQAEAISAVWLKARKNRLRAMLQIRALLTPEQRQELIRIREESHSRRRHRRLGACQADVAKICPSAEPGRATVQCLSEHWGALSQECRFIFEARPHGGLKRGGRFGLPPP